MENNRLFIRPKLSSSPKLRVFCFPYAGGSAKTYLDWAEHFSDDIEIVAVQPPGRATRIDEAPYENVHSLVDELMAYAAFITQTPYVFIGHSLGCRVAFELACQLQSLTYPAPVHFFASGCPAPHLRDTHPNTYDLPHEAFIHELQKMNGATDEVLLNNELMALMLPVLRADFKMAETYRAKRFILKSPITVLSGESDPDIKPIELYAWSELSSENLTIQSIPGDHFFIDQNKEKVIKIMASLLESM
ncbi:pyochelin biosynthetic protein PchC [Xenorhabdus beddingii]|uniref:Pyochelin biosynthetic protein PchC n=1 Tax=Xenorhabdus beddingii TaxID=40578 RepID=A0A1Y2SPL7_9GAMM|nr:alpha/beta fold hydrolase [Xenorhabdus beddingii]OTA19604.1 pyochelin biosynthetic protein PchC [Xenorhabdus beddingii]